MPLALGRIAAYGLSSLLAALVFLPGVTAGFVSDDWPTIANSANVSLANAPQLFAPVHQNWYRPLFGLFVGITYNVFGLNPTGYHLAVFLMYASIAALVGNLGELMTGERRIGLLSTVLFAINGAHAEPVLWIASANEILAGLFVVLAMSAYVQFRRSGTTRWLLATGLFYVLGITSKETAVSLPVMLVAYDLLLHRSTKWQGVWQKLAASGPFLLLGLAFVVFRLVNGSPYSMAVEISRIGINLLYYLAVEALALPDNYGYLTALTLWGAEPILPIVTVGLATSGLTVGGWMLLRSRSERGIGLLPLRGLAFAAAWGLIGLGPVFLTGTGRTAFVSSMGVAWAIAIVFVSLWRRLPRRGGRRWLLLALALLVSANLLVSAYRTYWWRQAGDTMQATLAQLDVQLRDVPDGAEVWLVGVPDHLRHAYTFRNAFPAAGQLLNRRQIIRMALDTDIAGLTRQQAIARVVEGGKENIVILWYEEGALERVPVVGE